MPICKRDGFDAPSKNKNDCFQDNDEVFFCEVTKEIFRDYEDYFRHVMVINSTVWQCEATGRDNLTYAEALKSEKKARKKMELFKDILRPPVMLVIDHAKQSSINALNTIVFKFIKRRFFRDEEVSAAATSTKYKEYVVVDIIDNSENPPASGVYEETEKLLYKLGPRDPKQSAELITVPFEKIKRQRIEFTLENLQMFIKTNVTRVDGILRPKADAYKRYVTDRNITFSSIFIGKMPHFTPAKIKRPVQESANAKKQSTLNKYLVKNDEKSDNQKTSSKKLTAKDLAKREEEREKQREAKAKSLKEEMERIRKEKQERLAELERQKAEKRAKLMEKIDAQCNDLLIKTDDLERSDQRLLPSFIPIVTYIPTKFLGDAFMVREFMHSFGGILSGIEVFRNNVSFYEISRSFSEREVAGPLSDILLILLGTIFDLQKEEEDECSVEYLKMRKEQREREPFTSMSKAAFAHVFAKRHYSFKVNELPLDALTISEVLRLHLLSSGSAVKEKAEKWRMMYRNGYTSPEDPGLILRMQFPHILQHMKMYTVYQLPFRDIMRILKCLIAQILSYSSPINVIEERMEQSAKGRFDLRTINAAENKRVAAITLQRKTLTNEFNQQCLEDTIKADADKKRQLEEKLNKKIAELMAQSDREHKKYLQKVEEMQSSLFNFLVYLGMDRAYRKYYVLESIPGLFIEHPQDCMDTCLSEPPINAISTLNRSNNAALPKTRKELRAYLLKMYTDEEKKAAEAEKNLKNKTNSLPSQENKENQENVVVNGLTNGHAESEDKENETAVTEEVTPPAPPTQYQLYMCTGDKRNCIVHDERNADRQRWAYIYEEEDIAALIDSLNPLGDREAHLREQLTTLRHLIVQHVRKCPFDLLTMDKEQMPKFRTQMLSETNRKYNKSNIGFSIEHNDLNEVMYSALVERVLQFESDIYTGDLGRLKVKNMEKWRTDIQNNCYDSQNKLQWGPPLHQQKMLAASGAGAEDDDELMLEAGSTEIEEDLDAGGQYANKVYRDAGEGLGTTNEIDTDDSDDDELPSHDSELLKTCVKNLASALLQVEQAIERRFIKEPFGPPQKDTKDKEVFDKKQKYGANRLKQWEVSLMECTSYSQVFVHLNVLHDCILWSRSTNKSNCQVCRRGSDPDKMLLCDECNGGTHMFCMKPKMKTVPEGNWYCSRCVNKLGLKNQSAKAKATKRKRTFIMDEEDTVSETSEISSNAKTNGRKSGGANTSSRRSNKRLVSEEIEQALEDDDNEEDDEEMEVDEENTEEGSDAEQNNGEAEDEEENDDSEEEQEQEEDENDVCIVCNYDGGELYCVRCKDCFHMECINLKRAPRYNYICNSCKSKEDKKRKAKAQDTDETDEDDESEPEPPAKRSRSARSSLRNSLPNGNAKSDSKQESKSNGGRRSHRRTTENLPLNSSALYELLEDMAKHKDAWPFLRPVLQSEVPDYYEIIKDPMDMATIKSKLNMGEYHLNEEIMNDVHLMFKNCDQYNISGNEIYEAGTKFEKYVAERCKDLNLPFKLSDLNN